MSTQIEWTDETWNPAVGCERVSPGCDNCYAVRVAHREMQPAHVGLTGYDDSGERRPGPFWTGEVRLLPERLEEPFRWRRPRRVFVGSMTDLFHPAVPDSFIAEVFAVMVAAGQHTYQVLTKRPQRMAALVGDPAFRREVEYLVHTRHETHMFAGWPYPSIWLGTSVENQRYADLRIPHLLATPAAVRFLSIAPLLGAVVLPDAALYPNHASVATTPAIRSDTTVGWVIVGGESGPGARPMHPAWVRSLRDQCVAAGVPFFFKQWGEWGEFAPTDRRGVYDTSRMHGVALDGTVYTRADIAWPDGPRRGEAARAGHNALQAMYRVGKKAAGRELDGATWSQMPEAAA